MAVPAKNMAKITDVPQDMPSSLPLDSPSRQLEDLTSSAHPNRGSLRSWDASSFPDIPILPSCGRFHVAIPT
jgi:hypothetical protein